MQSKLGRACAAAAGLITLLAPSAASASWWDGGYQPARRHQPPPSQPPPDRQPPPQQSPGGQQPPSGNYGGEQPPPQQQPPQQPPPQQAPPPGNGYGGEQPAPTQPGPTQPAPQQPPSCCYGPEQPAPPAPLPPPLPGNGIYGCDNSDLVGTRPVLRKETTPPDGTPVQPGDEIVVEITWRVTDWIAPDLHKALDCVYINNRYVPGLSGGERPTPNDGHFAWHYVVPADVPPGSTICDQGFVSGPNGSEEYGREVSNIVCFPVGPPPVPPPPVPPPPPPPAETTTTTGQAQPQRIGLQVPPTTAPVAPQVLPRERDVLPRTGGDAKLPRLAAQALGLALLGSAGVRRWPRLRRR
jgi:hypothetical protein